VKKRKNKDFKPYLVAITGNFGSGKSAVGSLLKNDGFLLVDTDEIVNEILKNINPVTEKILAEFGSDIKNLNSDYLINKKKLASIVFIDETKRKKLEFIIHPAVEQTLSTIFSLSQLEKVIFVLVPLLFECNLEGNYHEVWCVKCDKNVQLSRLEGRGFSIEEAEKRISSQMSQDEKESLSDFVIDNSAQIENTKSQIDKRLKNGFN
jgi:dephospho-CoA kinase